MELEGEASLEVKKRQSLLREHGIGKKQPDYLKLFIIANGQNHGYFC